MNHFKCIVEFCSLTKRREYKYKGINFIRYLFLFLRKTPIENHYEHILLADAVFALILMEKHFLNSKDER